MGMFSSSNSRNKIGDDAVFSLKQSNTYWHIDFFFCVKTVILKHAPKVISLTLGAHFNSPSFSLFISPQQNTLFSNPKSFVLLSFQFLQIVLYLATKHQS